MMIDRLLEFVPHSGAAASMVAGAGVNVAVGDVIDLLGSGAGTAPANIIGNASVFGQDPGIGRTRPEIQINIGTAFVTGNAATANFALQYAPDNGAFNPGTWDTGAEIGAKAASVLTAQQVLRLAIPPTPPSTPRPRFVRLLMQVPAATNFTAGTITAAFVTQARDDLASKQGTRNYVVA